MLPSLGKLSLAPRTGMMAGGSSTDPLPEAPEDDPAQTILDQIDEESFIQAMLTAVRHGDVLSACESASMWCSLDRASRRVCQSIGMRDEWRELLEHMFTAYAPFPEIWADHRARFFEICKMPARDRFNQTLDRFETSTRQELGQNITNKYAALRNDALTRRFYFIEESKRQEWRTNQIAKIDADETQEMQSVEDDVKRANLPFLAANAKTVLRLLFAYDATNRESEALQRVEAGLMLGALVRDTLHITSNTTAQRLALLANLETIQKADVRYDCYTPQLLQWLVQKLEYANFEDDEWNDYTRLRDACADALFRTYTSAAQATDWTQSRVLVAHPGLSNSFATELARLLRPRDWHEQTLTMRTRISRAQMIGDWALKSGALLKHNLFQEVLVLNSYDRHVVTSHDNVHLSQFANRLFEMLRNGQREKLAALRALAAVASTRHDPATYLETFPNARQDPRAKLVRIATLFLNTGENKRWICEIDLLQFIDLLQECVPRRYGNPLVLSLLPPEPEDPTTVCGETLETDVAGSWDADTKASAARLQINLVVTSANAQFARSRPRAEYDRHQDVRVGEAMVIQYMEELIAFIAYPTPGLDFEVYRNTWKTMFVDNTENEDANEELGRMTELLQFAGQSLTNPSLWYWYKQRVARFLVNLYGFVPELQQCMDRADLTRYIQRFLEQSTNLSTDELADPSLSANRAQRSHAADEILKTRAMTDEHVAVWRGLNTLYGRLAAIGSRWREYSTFRAQPQRRLVCTILMGIATISVEDVNQIYRLDTRSSSTIGLNTNLLIYMVRLVELNLLSVLQGLVEHNKDDEILERIVEALFIGMRRHLSDQFRNVPISQLSQSAGMTVDRLTSAVLVLSEKERALKLPTRQRARAEEDAFLEETRKRIAAEVLGARAF